MLEIKQNYSLKALNTFGIAAKAKYFVSVKTIADLKEALLSDEAKSNELFFLGGGSNMLLTKDLDYFVIKLDLQDFEISEQTATTALVSAGAGFVWHEFVMKTLDHSLFGLENLSLIPGSVGACPIQNIGAYGAEVKDTMHHLEALNLETLEIEEFTNEKCNFGYRESVFKSELKGKYAIVKVFFELSKIPNLKMGYGAIKSELEALKITVPTPKDVSTAIINIRSSKLPDPKEIGNSGSFFKNPVISNTIFNSLLEKHPQIAHYKVDDKLTKLAAGWLIDQCGWKGKTINNSYGVHKNQALVLVNYGTATGQEIFDLSSEIIQSVKDTFGVTLTREVNIY